MPESPTSTQGLPAANASHQLGTEWFADQVARVKLTPKGRVVAHFIASNPRYASFASASELAEHTQVNVATVVRFAQSLGFSGWPEFQLHLHHRYLGSLLPSGVLRDHDESGGRAPTERALRRDIENLEAAVDSVDVAKVQEVAALIAAAPRTLIVASGSFAAPGLILAHLGHFMGHDIHLEARGPVNVVAALSNFGPGDCVITMSFWRVLKDAMLTTAYCKRQGITTVTLTDSLFSEQAQLADHALVVPTESVSFFQSMTAATSLIHGLLAELQNLGGERVAQNIERLERAYEDLDVLYR
jgi:DNA-binding MurR/RpiR family transcriptional regulator